MNLDLVAGVPTGSTGVQPAVQPAVAFQLVLRTPFFNWYSWIHQVREQRSNFEGSIPGCSNEKGSIVYRSW